MVRPWMNKVRSVVGQDLVLTEDYCSYYHETLKKSMNLLLTIKDIRLKNKGLQNCSKGLLVV